MVIIYIYTKTQGDTIRNNEVENFLGMLSTKFTKKEVEDISVVSEQNNIINLLTNVTIDTAFEFLQALEKSGKLNDSLREKILSERMNIVGRC